MSKSDKQNKCRGFFERYDVVVTNNIQFYSKTTDK